MTVHNPLHGNELAGGNGNGNGSSGGSIGNLSFDLTPGGNSAGGTGGTGSSFVLGDTGGGASNDSAALSYLIGQSKPLSFNLDSQTPRHSDSGTSTGGSSFTVGGSDGTGFTAPGGLSFVSFAKTSGHGHSPGSGPGGSNPPPATYSRSNSAGMTFVVNWDSSVGNAPSGFVSGVETAVNNFLLTFASPIKITIDVGYGELLGNKLPHLALGASTFNLDPFHYSDLYNQSQMSSWSSTGSPDQKAAFKSLPSNGSDPLGDTQYLLTSANARALGLPDNNTLDGAVGFATQSKIVPWNWGPSTATTSGQYDFVSVAEHEISEVMGRLSWLGNTVQDNSGNTYKNSYSNLDLFRYQGNGVRSTTSGGSAYLSFDGGKTDLTDFNTDPKSGDLGDWAITNSSAQNPPGNDQTPSYDAYNYAAAPGPLVVSNADTQAMNLLGYTTQTGLTLS